MIFSLPTIEATERLAARLKSFLRKGDVLALKGDLGAGKTVFVRALLQAFGVDGEIPSPTFTLVQPYEAGGVKLYHYDLYRLKNESEMEELAWDEAQADGIVCVEWPEKAGSYLPLKALSLNFSIVEDERRQLVLDGSTEWKKRLEGLSL